MTHVADDALWWQTMLQSEPWNTSPPFSRLINFRLSMIVPDLLHCWNLGISRHMLASCLKILLSDQIVFPAPTLPGRLKMASESLLAFARRHRYPLRMKKITKNKLKWKARRYPELASSGYDAFVVGTWLEQTLTPHNHHYPEIATLLWSSNKGISLLYSAGAFLTTGEKQSVKVYGDIFLQTYVTLAGRALNEHKLLFRVIPKLHLMSHIFNWKRSVNPSRYSTWMDEDYLKKIGKTLGLTQQKTAQQRLLQRWLLSIPNHLKRNLG